VTLAPVKAWWLDISLIAVFVADLAALAFVLVYSFIFTFAVDYLFGSPASATNNRGD